MINNVIKGLMIVSLSFVSSYVGGVYVWYSVHDSRAAAKETYKQGFINGVKWTKKMYQLYGPPKSQNPPENQKGTSSYMVEVPIS